MKKSPPLSAANLILREAPGPTRAHAGRAYFIPCYCGYSHCPHKFATPETRRDGLAVLALTLAHRSHTTKNLRTPVIAKPKPNPNLP